MERLQKVIAQSGICSRRKAEELILAGKVRVNGQLCTTLGTKVRGDDEIQVNGKKLERENHVYYLLNKPKGCITSTRDDKDRTTILSYLPEEHRLYPVGRLDYDTSGALIVTNDGDFTNKMIHPRYHIPKTYLVNLQGLLSDEDVLKLRRGFSTPLGTFQPARVKILSKDYHKKRTQLELTIYEGQNHQVKNMMKALGHEVRRLHRQRFGSLDVNSMRPGEYRRLKPFEIKQLLRQAQENL